MKVYKHLICWLALLLCLLVGTFMFGGCTHGQDHVVVKIVNVLPKAHTHKFAVATLYRKQQEPTGLSAFPDGGLPKVIEEEARIYVCDMDAVKVDKVASIRTMQAVAYHFLPSLVCWDGESLYFQISGSPFTMTTKENVLFFRMDCTGKVLPTQSVPSIQQGASEQDDSGAHVFAAVNYDTIMARPEGQKEMKPLLSIDPSSGDFVFVSIKRTFLEGKMPWSSTPTPPPAPWPATAAPRASPVSAPSSAPLPPAGPAGPQASFSDSSPCHRSTPAAG